MRDLASLNSLTGFDLGYCKGIRDVFATCLESLIALKELKLNGCKNVFDICVEQSRSPMKSLAKTDEKWAMQRSSLKEASESESNSSWHWHWRDSVVVVIHTLDYVGWYMIDKILNNWMKYLRLWNFNFIWFSSFCTRVWWFPARSSS